MDDELTARILLANGATECEAAAIVAATTPEEFMAAMGAAVARETKDFYANTKE